MTFPTRRVQIIVDLISNSMMGSKVRMIAMLSLVLLLADEPFDYVLLWCKRKLRIRWRRRRRAGMIITISYFNKYFVGDILAG